MKNLTKLSLYLLPCIFLLVACGGETSTKGNWSSSDMDRCTSDMISEMKDDPESEEMLELAGVSMEDFASCACEKVESLYESESAASIALDGMSDEEVGMLILSCFGDLSDMIEEAVELEESFDDRGWTEEMANEFLDGCVGDEAAMQGYCACVLENIMTDFDPSDLEYWDDEDYESLADLYSDCLELIEY